jgi:drug/metabolite transporter (DMT)-like permease
MVLLSKSYTIGDLSKVYPIMRGISPLIVPIIGVFFLNENLQILGWVGIVLIVLGIFSLSDNSLLQKKFLSKDSILAILVGCCVASYMIIDKLALAYMPPVILNLFINLGSFISLSFFITDRKALRVEWEKNWNTILIVAVLMPASFLIFLYALSLAEVSLLAPMREIGTVFGAILGVVLLKEKQGAKRIISSVIITIGVIVLGIWN